MLQKLADEQKKLSEWVALGTVDLEEFVDAHLEDVQDWELNFRILKVGLWGYRLRDFHFGGHSVHKTSETYFVDDKSQESELSERSIFYV